MAGAADSIRVGIWRGGAGGDNTLARYLAPRRPNQTVLDVVTWIQQNAEPSLGYRFSCRVGMCGTCAMTVNGAPRWTCRTHVKRVVRSRDRRGPELELAPLRNLPVIKDLACDMSAFFDKWQLAEGRFHPSKERHDPVARVSADDPQRAASDAGIECINCAVCYAACDVVAWNPAYLGPAALNRAWTLQNDTRDNAHRRRLRAVSDRGGCQNCHSQQGCTHHCPVAIAPARAIAGLKRQLAAAAWRGWL